MRNGTTCAVALNALTEVPYRRRVVVRAMDEPTALLPDSEISRSMRKFGNPVSYPCARPFIGLATLSLLDRPS